MSKYPLKIVYDIGIVLKRINAEMNQLVLKK